jgi:hypothetical protein
MERYSLLKTESGSAYLIDASIEADSMFPVLLAGLVFFEPGQPDKITLYPGGNTVLVPQRFQKLSTEILALNQQLTLL